MTSLRNLLVLLGVIIGILAGGVTLLGAIQGQPDLLGQYAVRINEILDLGVELLRKCTTECFD